jgi:hypothetical protein
LQYRLGAKKLPAFTLIDLPQPAHRLPINFYQITYDEGPFGE